MLTKLHSNEEEKNKGTILNMAINAPYKRKVIKLEFSKHEIESPSEGYPKHTTEKYKDSSESSDSNQKKMKYKLYEQISAEFKKIKPLIFNREIEKGEEAEAW